MQEKYKVPVYQGPQAEGLPLPKCAHAGEDVAMDVPTCKDVTIPANGRSPVETCLRFKIPPGKYMHVYGKGPGAKAGLSINLVIVDQGYTGWLTFDVWNMS